MLVGRSLGASPSKRFIDAQQPTAIRQCCRTLLYHFTSTTDRLVFANTEQSSSGTFNSSTNAILSLSGTSSSLQQEGSWTWRSLSRTNKRQPRTSGRCAHNHTIIISSSDRYAIYGHMPERRRARPSAGSSSKHQSPQKSDGTVLVAEVLFWDQCDVSHVDIAFHRQLSIESSRAVQGSQ